MRTFRILSKELYCGQKSAGRGTGQQKKEVEKERNRVQKGTKYAEMTKKGGGSPTRKWFREKDEKSSSTKRVEEKEVTPGGPEVPSGDDEMW